MSPIYRFIGAGVGFFLGVTLLVEEINEAIRSSIENAVPEEPGDA